MDKFDSFMDKLKKSFDKGKRRRANPEYTKAIRSGKVPRDRHIPPHMGKDEGFKRLRYVRYADDFLVGIIGSHADCVTIREKIQKELSERLKLTLNLEKSKITHALKDSAVFLGYKIHNTPTTKQPLRYVKKDNKEILARITSRPILDAPIEKIVIKLKERGFCKGPGNPTRCGRLIHLNPVDIITHYKNVEAGLINYYSMANNYGRFTARVHYILKYSCALTLASKLRLKTLKGVFNKFGKDLTINKVTINEGWFTQRKITKKK
jgi:hypothetical protein